jgi:hypothetical protein
MVKGVFKAESKMFGFAPFSNNILIHDKFLNPYSCTLWGIIGVQGSLFAKSASG